MFWIWISFDKYFKITNCIVKCLRRDIMMNPQIKMLISDPFLKINVYLYDLLLIWRCFNARKWWYRLHSKGILNENMDTSLNPFQLKLIIYHRIALWYVVLISKGKMYIFKSREALLSSAISYTFFFNA